MSEYGPATTAIHAAEEGPKPYNSLTTPVVFSTSFPFGNNDEVERYFEGELERGNEYIRYGHPTLAVAERKLAAIEGCDGAMLTASGMSAITITILSMLRSGQHVVITADSYRKTRIFVRDFLQRYGIEHSVVDPSVPAIEAACTPQTRLIISESPTNPYLRCIDCEQLASFARSKRIKTLIDATLATPYNLKPLDLGIDLVVHSCTKYLGGHNDLMAGAVLGKDGIISALRESQGMFGALPGPLTAYLLVRGLKTFPLRMRQVNESTLQLARFLERHPRVEQVWYPGLESHQDHDIASRQMRGFGGVVSFTVTADRKGTSRVVDACRIPHLAPTFGGPESLISQPAVVSYYDLAPEQLKAIGISENLVRYCVGLEETEDLIADLDQALQVI